MISLVTAEQMRAVEAAEFATGTTEDELSDRAAAAIHKRLLDIVSGGEQVLVVAGPGNNGLDAVKIHRLLEASGIRSVLRCWHRSDCSEESSDIEAQLAESSVVVDGLFGIGLTRAVEGEPAQLLELINAERERREYSQEPLLVLSIDIPSGLNSNTGEALGVVANADITVTLGLPKIGLFTGAGPTLAGDLVVERIGLSPREVEGESIKGFDRREHLTLPRRRVASHKNDNGRVLVIGGSLRYPGAPVLSALAAHAAGAGYVTVGFPRSMLGLIGGSLLEQTLLPLPESDVGALGPAAVGEAREAAAGYKALLVGNGLHREDGTVEFVLELLGVPGSQQRRQVGFVQSHGARSGSRVSQSRPVGFRRDNTHTSKGESQDLPPTVVDGDGLYALSTQESWWQNAPSVAVLTPHPGEMARLVDRKVTEVEADRLGVAREAAQKWGKTVLLKGSYPVIAGPEGEVEVLIEGHPELGTAGTGDVLAGTVAFALSLGLRPVDAARAALVLGARSATLAAEQVGRDAVGAGDLAAALPAARSNSRARWE